jgi:hypothetical protein
MHGLALDFIDSVTVVLADGRIVEASNSKNQDLLWGIKGAGSNFGIVASWNLRTYEAPKTLTRFGVSLGWKNKTTAVAGLKAVEAYIKDVMPREVNFRVADYGGGGAGIEGLYYGNDDKWRAAFDPLLKTLPAGWNITALEEVDWITSVLRYSNYDEIDWITPSPVSQPPDSLLPSYLTDSQQENFYAKSLALKGLNGKSLENFVDYWFDVAMKVEGRQLWFFQLDVHGGKHSQITKVPNHATSYPHRDKLYLIQFYDRYENDEVYPPTSLPFLDGWVDATTEPLKQYEWGAYANYADPRLENADELYYGANLPRLQKLKAKYDPKQLFYYPQGVQPRA